MYESIWCNTAAKIGYWDTDFRFQRERGWCSSPRLPGRVQAILLVKLWQSADCFLVRLSMCFPSVSGFCCPRRTFCWGQIVMFIIHMLWICTLDKIKIPGMQGTSVHYILLTMHSSGFVAKYFAATVSYDWLHRHTLTTAVSYRFGLFLTWALAIALEIFIYHTGQF